MTPAAEATRVSTINRLRELLNSNTFADNAGPYLQNTDFLSNRLLKLEIKRENPDNDLVGEVNAADSDQERKGFVLGYIESTALHGDYILTLSALRKGGIRIYGGDFIDPDVHPGDNLMFFHDTPTYSGMSGGAVFNTPAAHADEINIKRMKCLNYLN